MRIRFVALALILTACGGGTDKVEAEKTPDKAKECSPSGTTLGISIKDTAFEKDCLAAPADQPFTIDVDNKDALEHNFSIYTDKDVSQNLFMGTPFAGPKLTTYEVPAMAAGNYYFQCDIHPETNGAFIVA